MDCGAAGAVETGGAVEGFLAWTGGVAGAGFCDREGGAAAKAMTEAKARMGARIDVRKVLPPGRGNMA